MQKNVQNKRAPSEAELLALRARKAIHKSFNAAVAEGDMETCKAMVRGGVGWDECFGGKGPCALEIAARVGRAEFFAEAMFERFGLPDGKGGVDHEETEGRRSHRLALARKCASAAALSGQAATLSIASSYGARLDRPLGSHGMDACEIGIKIKNPDVFLSGLSCLPKGAQGPLYQAVEQLDGADLVGVWDRELSRVVSEAGAGFLDEPNERGLTLLGAAIDRKDLAWIEKLASWGASVDAPCKHGGETPLIAAASTPSLIKKLLALGADPGKRADNGANAFRTALRINRGTYESCTLLWADARSRDRWWEGQCGLEDSALWQAARHDGQPGWSRWMVELVESAPLSEIVRRDSQGGLLSAMLGCGRIEICEALWKNGASLTDGNFYERSALGLALHRYWRAGRAGAEREEAALKSLDWADSKGASYMAASGPGTDLLEYAIENKLSPRLLKRIESGFDMAKRREAGWSTMAKMLIHGYETLSDLEHMAVSGGRDEEISDWMEAVGAAGALGKDDLAMRLRERARSCKEKWAMRESLEEGATENPSKKLGRL